MKGAHAGRNIYAGVSTDGDVPSEIGMGATRWDERSEQVQKRTAFKYRKQALCVDDTHDLGDRTIPDSLQHPVHLRGLSGSEPERQHHQMTEVQIKRGTRIWFWTSWAGKLTILFRACCRPDPPLRERFRLRADRHLGCQPNPDPEPRRGQMARTRNLKPGFFKNVKLAKLGPWCRLLFAGLWTIADREGRLVDEPEYIRAEIFPYDRKIEVNELLDKLKGDGFIVRYRHGDDKYIAIPTWLKHQKPYIREAPSAIPEYGEALPEHDLGSAKAVLEHNLDSDEAQPKHRQGSSSLLFTALPSTFPPHPPPATAVVAIGSEYPQTIAEIRKHDAAVDEAFVRGLANKISHTILSHPTFPQEECERAMQDAVIAKACRESFATGPPGHRAGLLLARVPNIIVSWGLEKET